MPLDAGFLNWRYTLQRPNGEDGSYADVATIWANVRGATGQELLRFGDQASVGAYVVTIRYRNDLKASWRLTDVANSPEHSLQIQSFSDPDGLRESLDLFCVVVQ